MGRAERCKHYRGMHQRDACEAGVRFDSLPGFGTSQFFDVCPCLQPCGGCDKAAYRTPEEVEEEEQQIALRLAATATTRAAIVEHLGGPWRRGMPSASGTIDCPVCGQAQALRYSRAGFNGHIHAACTTAGCVRWME